MASYRDTLADLGVTNLWSFPEASGTAANDSIGSDDGVYTHGPGAVVVETNLITNPSFETDLNGWTPGGCTNARIVGPGGYGAAFMRMTCTAAGQFGCYTAMAGLPTVTPGQSYAAGVNVVALPSGKQARLVIEWRNASGIVQTLNAPLTSTLGWRTVVGVAPAGADRALLNLVVSGGTIGDVLDADGYFFAQSSDASISYFDGDSPNARWTGTANASTSELLEPLAQGRESIMFGEPDGAFDTAGGTGFVFVPDPDGHLAIGATFSLGVWARVHSLPASGYKFLFRKDANGPYLIVLADGSVQLAYFDGASKSMTSPTGVVSPELRVFIGVEVNAATGEGRVYINGERVTTQPLVNAGAWNDYDIGWGARPDGTEGIDATLDGAFLGRGCVLGDDGWMAAYEAGRYPDIVFDEPETLQHTRIANATDAVIVPELDAARYDNIVVQNTRTLDRDAIHAQNTGTKVFAYQNLAFIGEGSLIADSATGVAEEGADPSWFLLDSGGARVTSWTYTWLQFADIGSASYREAWADQVITRCAGFDGIFIDDLDFTYASQQDIGVLVAYPDGESYGAAMGGALEYVSKRLRDAGFEVAGNIAKTTENRAVTDDWLPYVDYVLNEQGLRFSGSGVYAYHGYSEPTIDEALVAKRFGTRTWLAVPFNPGDVDGATYGASVARLVSGALVANPWPVNYLDTAWDEDVFKRADALGKGEDDPVQVDGIWTRKFAQGRVYVNVDDSSYQTYLINGDALRLDAKHGFFISIAETSFGAELYDSVAPLAYADADNGYALRTVCDAIGTMANQLEQLTREDSAGNAPWSIIMDLDRAEGYMLPYLAQFVGQTIPVGTPDDEARELIRTPSNQERGTVAKMVNDAKRTLTGTKYVRVVERDGSPWKISFFVRTTECPDPNVTKAAIVAVKPAGVIVNFVASPGVVIDELAGTIDTQTGTIDSLSGI